MIMHNERQPFVASDLDLYFVHQDRGNPSEKALPNVQEPHYWVQEFDVNSVREDFPILHRRMNNKNLVWLDNSATTQKPKEVIDSLYKYYTQYNSNIHRGAHTLANLATQAYEDAREKIRDMIGATDTEEVIFTKGTTEAINLVAESYGEMNIKEGDEIILSIMEHHSNIVPWQKLQQEKGAIIKVIPINDRGDIILEDYEKLLSPRTKMVAFTHVSNVLGTINPVKAMIAMAHRHGACVLIDGAQAVPHLAIDVKDMDADFYAFSGHKMYGPTGIGILYGKKALLDQMPPWQRGGGMIRNVSFNQTTYNDLPYKFEAGTGNIADAIGLGAATDYIKRIGMKSIEDYEKEVTSYAVERLLGIPRLRLIGTAQDKISVLAFVIKGITAEDVGRYLNQQGVAVRAGHHCAQPVLKHYGLSDSVRASIGIYNTKSEIDYLTNAILQLVKKHM